MTVQKLYMAVWVDHPHDAHEQDEFGIFPTDYVDYQEPEPAGWREYALDRWGDAEPEHERWPNGYKPFFWPKTDVPYKSRSTAQKRVDIINYWGGNAVVVECTPKWEPVAVANARRAAERHQKRIDRKRAELAALEAQHPSVGGVFHVTSTNPILTAAEWAVLQAQAVTA